MKTKSFNFLAIIILILAGILFTGTDSFALPPKKPKNIILFIGDGMGVAQVYAAISVNDHPFYLEQFPYSGFSITYSADSYVTDSGAGGTAIACGVKTKNGMIGVLPDGTAVPSITEIAHSNGMSTGVLSTSTVTHATPASFVAHNSGRGNYEDIALDFLKGTVDVFIGGGENNFRSRADGKDLTVDLKAQGFDVVYTIEDLKASKSSKIAGLLAKEHMPTVLEGRDGALEEMVRKATQTLSQDKDGFFLMVEGSMIDWGAHENNIDYTLAEVTDLDKAIGAALEFARTNKETLIVVTADHETGGLTIPSGNLKDKDDKITVNFSTKGHTGVMVPIFSYGPGAEQFSGINENTFFLNRFLKLLKIKK
jgi:alkaline phosphatase